VPIFSPVAVACVGALIVTGGVGAWVHLPSLASLTESPNGRTLLVKLLLAVVVLALGFTNWKKLTPRLVDADGPDALRRAATVELLVMQAVLIVTALLVRTAPPMG
jgi:putative copper resistance protein D